MLNKALRRLPKDLPSAKSYRLTAFQSLSKVYDKAGDLGTAESWLQQALDATHGDQDYLRAMLVWQAGNLAIRRDEPLRAREHLDEALELLLETEARESLLVALDLARVLLNLGEPEKAAHLAQNMAQLIGATGQGELEKGTLVELIRASIEGRLSTTLIDRLRSQVGHRSAA